MIEGRPAARVDVLDARARFVTSADCELTPRPGGGGWGGVLTAVEPNAHLGSGRYRLRLRDGAEAVVVIQARQRIGGRERYPFVGEGRPLVIEPA